MIELQAAEARSAIELPPRSFKPAVYRALRRAGFRRRDVLRAMWLGIDDIVLVKDDESSGGNA